MKKLLMLGASGLVMMSVPAIAGHHNGENYSKDKSKEMFQAADANSDGMISKDEYMAHVQIKAADKFAAKDTNADGNISMEEADAYKKKKHSEMKERKVMRKDKVKAEVVSEEQIIDDTKVKAESSVTTEVQSDVE